jgi:hypothetical protein
MIFIFKGLRQGAFLFLPSPNTQYDIFFDILKIKNNLKKIYFVSKI